MTKDTDSQTAYEHWMAQEGPITEGYGLNITQMPLDTWTRRSGRGAFVQLRGMEGATGMEVLEMPAGKALEAEKHLYEEIIYVVEGVGSTEVWREGEAKRFFEWGPGSLFALPLNCWHRLVNGGCDRVLLAAVTNAPMVIDMFHNIDFIFNCDLRFEDRYDAQEDYFTVGSKRYVLDRGNYWDTILSPTWPLPRSTRTNGRQQEENLPDSRLQATAW